MSSSSFQLQFWLYFHLLDKQIMDQDETDGVDCAQKAVKLSPMQTLKMISGVTIGKYI